MLLKKLAILSIASLGMSGLAQAANIAVDGTQGKAVTAKYSAGTGQFVVTDFEYTVSANVNLVSLEDTVAFAVGAASKKGRTPYSGSSNGGSVSVCGEATTGADVPSAPVISLAATATSGCGDQSGS